MKYAILGSGNMGSALARIFARHKIEVAIANSRGADTLSPLAKELGPVVSAVSFENAIRAEISFLAVPFSAYQKVAEQSRNWVGKTLIDVTNAMHVSLHELGGRLSSEIIAEAFSGVRLVKAFNHLPAAQLGTHEAQSIFVSSNDAEAAATVAALATQLGFAPVQLGKLNEGGVPLHFVDGKPGGLIFQNLAKLQRVQPAL